MPSPSQKNVANAPVVKPTAHKAATKPSTVSNSPTIRRQPTQQQLNRRQVRAAQRAAERRRRTYIVSGVLAALVVAALVFVLKDHLPFSTSKASTSTAHQTSACAPTATVVGPAPHLVVPATPPPAPANEPVQTGDQGLKYIDITAGCGTAVKAGDNVTVNYSGWTQADGRLFDSSLKPGRTPFQVQNVGNAQLIQGWNIGLQGMKPGGTRRLIIPASLGYGSAGAPQGGIPPNATLIFDITLISIDQ